MRTVDLKKLLEFFPKSKSSKPEVDKLSLAAYGVVIVLLVAILQKPNSSGSFGGTEKNKADAPTTILAKSDMSEFLNRLAALTNKPCQQCSPQQPALPPPIYVSVPASPGPTINIPPTNLPSKVDVILPSTVPPAETKFEQNINLPPAPPATSQDRDHQPSGSDSTPTMHGDTLVPFSVPKNKRAPDAIFTTFSLTGPSEEVCEYNARLSVTAGKWPPNPIQMTIYGVSTPTKCPQIPKAGSRISVSSRPLYSAVLKAYISLVDVDSRLRLFGHDFGRDQIVILIHYAAPDFN